MLLQKKERYRGINLITNYIFAPFKIMLYYIYYTACERALLKSCKISHDSTYTHTTFAPPLVSFLLYHPFYFYLLFFHITFIYFLPKEGEGEREVFFLNLFIINICVVLLWVYIYWMREKSFFFSFFHSDTQQYF